MSQQLAETEEYRTCSYNTNQEPDGLWGQCYEEACTDHDGVPYCAFHYEWVTYKKPCRRCKGTVKYDEAVPQISEAGGAHNILCRACLAVMDPILAERV